MRGHRAALYLARFLRLQQRRPTAGDSGGSKAVRRRVVAPVPHRQLQGVARPMVDQVANAAHGKREKTELVLGFVPLADAAPLIVAR